MKIKCHSLIYIFHWCNLNFNFFPKPLLQVNELNRTLVPILFIYWTFFQHILAQTWQCLRQGSTQPIIELNKKRDLDWEQGKVPVNRSIRDRWPLGMAGRCDCNWNFALSGPGKEGTKTKAGLFSGLESFLVGGKLVKEPHNTEIQR